ncbi:PREDICTED: disks large homolog 4-like isoform X1 [Amphimedon queenslandica]|uniref:Uncharacterized protein n=1 Tax=Amphimedon queenslandica TaxID=400682 RepID=A0A1X7VQJ0_AMPQE|nr:PREDICTED: disks large homolog 4-like isoform X1 [Amphimedon queenslandica]|eukprot:XP_019857331.1 PREDICTED: disks large homolog 4-like isoform X1 [Amphimedon queenslandica]
MPSKQEAYRALELLEQYCTNLERQPGSEELQETLRKAIVAIRSRLFQALLDIQEFYEVTLENAAKPVDVKTEETRKLAEKWEDSNPPIPVNVRRLAQHTIAPSVHADKKKEQSKSQSPATEELLQPSSQSIREDTVVIQKEEGRGLGLSVAGGTDNPHAVGETGIFITRLTPGSPAERSGLLQLGDQLLSVNNVPLVDVVHNDAVDALRNAGLTVTLRIRRFLDRVWSPASVDDLDDPPVMIKEHTSSPPPPPAQFTGGDSPTTVITLNKNGGTSLGFSIAGGKGNQHVLDDNGIFVTKITKGGVADQDGQLEVGDRVLEVNGQNMVEIDHEDAVAILKATGQEVTLKIEKNSLPQDITVTSDEGKAKVLSLLLQAPADKELIDKPRIITLSRPEGVGLGFNIIGGEEEVGIFISVISKEGVAADNGQLRVGDMILEVNGQNLETWSHETAAQALKTAGETVTLKVVYKPDEFEEFYRKMNIRPDQDVKTLYVR